MGEKRIGKVTHYFGRIQVAAIEIESGGLRQGDEIHILGRTTDFKQVVHSMQIDHEFVEEAAVGQAVGVKVAEVARENDHVYLVEEA
jgi:putative protease